MTISVSPMFCIISADDAESMSYAAVGAAESYEKETGNKPTHLWLHPDWEEEIDAEDFQFQTGMSPVFDAQKKNPSHIEVGIMNSAKPNGKAESAASPSPGNLWQAFQTDDPGMGNMFAAIKENTERFTAKTNMIPTHVSLHKSWMGKGEDVFKETGLQLVHEPPMPYAVNGYVGIRDVKETSLQVKSSNVKEVSFYPSDVEEGGTMFVSFINRAGKNGESDELTHYEYSDVPEEVYNELLASESKGSFINRRIKGKYPTTRLN